MKRYVLPSAVFVFSVVFISGIFTSNIWFAFGAMMAAFLCIGLSHP